MLILIKIPLGEITFSGGDGTDTVSMGVRIRATLDESNGPVGVNSMPGKLSFQTSSAGNQNPTERFTINSAGISTFFENRLSRKIGFWLFFHF